MSKNGKGPATRLADEMLMCRLVGHAWDEFNPIDKGRPTFGWRFSLRCYRCTTERHDLIDRLGGVAAREYLYPDGYQIVGLSRHAAPLRVEVARRRQASRQ